MIEPPDDKTQKVRAPWFSRDDYYYRKPRSMKEEDLTENELESRIHFAMASISARGEEGFKDGLPISAATVRERTKKPGPEFVVEKREPFDKLREIVEDESKDLRRRLAQIL